MSAVSTVRRTWAGVLAGLVNPVDPVPVAEALMRLLGHLEGFPDAAFTTDSARAVAVAKRYAPVPDFGVIYPALADWWRDNNPFQPALPAPRLPDHPEPTPDEHDHVRRVAAAWRAEVAQRETEEVACNPVRSRCVQATREELIAAYQAIIDADGKTKAAAGKRLRMLQREAV